MRFFVVYRRLMRHWEKVLPGRVYTVQYEALVAKPQETIKVGWVGRVVVSGLLTVTEAKVAVIFVL